MATANVKTASTTAKTTTTPKIVQKTETRLRDTDNTVLWTVLGLTDCEWSKKAVELLKEHKEQVKVISINAEWQRRLIVEFGTKRSPAIFKGATYFGSYDALESYYKCNFFSDKEVL